MAPAKKKIEVKNDEQINESMSAKIARLSKSIGINLKTDKDIVDAPRVSSGYLTIDYILNGGLEKSSFISLYGSSSTLKTTIGLKMLAESQKRGESCLIVNIEEGFNKTRLTQLGVDTSNVAILDEKMSGEEYYEMLSQVIGEFDFVLIDSITAMMPIIDDTKELDEGTIRGMEATMHARGLRKVNNRKKDAIIVMIAHEKQKVNTPTPATYMPGGKAPEFYSNYILNLRRKSRYSKDWKEIKQDINKERNEEEDIFGYEISVIGVKIRNSSPNKNINLQIELETGNTRRGHEAVKLGLLTGVIIQSGAQYTITALDKKYTGFDNLASVIDKDEELYNAIYKLIMSTINS